MKDYDVIIIGAGVSGCAIARELAKGKLRIAVLEAKVMSAKVLPKPTAVSCMRGMMQYRGLSRHS